MKKRTAIQLTLGCWVATILAVGVAWRSHAETVSGDIQLNSNLDGTTRTLPRVAMDDSKQYVAVWARLNGNNKDIFCRRFDDANAPLSSGSPATTAEFQVNTTTTCDSPDVAVDEDGKFVVVWEGTSSAPTNPAVNAIYARLYENTGVPVGGNGTPITLVNTATSNRDCHNPRVAMIRSGSNQGNFVVVWENRFDNSVYFQRYLSNGGLSGSAQQVYTSLVNTVDRPTVATNSSGEFITAYETNVGATGFDVQYKTWTSSGTILLPTAGSSSAIPGTIANATTAGDQRYPAAAMDHDNGGFVLAWEGVDATKQGIFFRTFNSAGTAGQASDQAVNTTTSGIQQTPAISMDHGAKRFAISWQSWSEVAAEYQIAYFRIFNNNASAASPEVKMNSANLVQGVNNTTNPYPAIAHSVDTRVVGVFQGAPGNGVNNVYARSFHYVPSLSATTNQAFGTGQPSTAISNIVITDDPTVPTIGNLTAIQVRIPSTFNMTWDTSITTATSSGAGAAKIASTLTYTVDFKTLVITANSDWAAGDALTLSGLKFNGFIDRSTAANLSLGLGSGTAIATAEQTIAVGRPTVSSSADQNFAVGQAVTAMSTITITEDAATAVISAGNDILIKIPTGFGMTWVTDISILAVLGGTAEGRVSTTPEYPDDRTLKLNVLTNFTVGQTLTVSGLRFSNFTSSDTNHLRLWTGGTTGSETRADPQGISVGRPTLSSGGHQYFGIGYPSTASRTFTLTDQSAGSFKATSDLRILIPAAFSMTWDTSVTSVTIGGQAAAKMDTSPTLAVSYESNGKRAVLGVLTDFATGDSVTVDGLKFTNFTGTDTASNLGLDYTADFVTDTSDGFSIGIGQPTFASTANQTFNQGQAAATATSMTVTEDAAIPSITTARDIRIVIPAGLSMEWNTAASPTFTGTAASNVGSVSYENGNKTAVIDVTADFAAGNTLVIANLGFANFTAVSSGSLTMTVGGSSGTTTATDTRTITINGPVLMMASAANQAFVVNQPAPAPAGSTPMATLTITDGNPATVVNGNTLNITIPATLPITWNAATLGTMVLGGTAATKVNAAGTITNAGQTLNLTVTANFIAQDTLTISGVSFTNFTVVAAPDRMTLSRNGGAAVATDSKTLSVVLTAADAEAEARGAGTCFLGAARRRR